MMYADIIPFVRLPRSQSTFTYAIPDGIAIEEGSIVEILFRNKRTYGCVLRVHRTAPVTYKPKLIDAVLPSLRLTASYCALLNDVAVTTCTSPSLIYRDVVPIPPKRIKTLDVKEYGEQQSLSLRKNAGTATLLRSTSAHAINVTIQKEINTAVKQKTRLLVLFPTHESMQQYLDSISTTQKKQIIVFHAQLGKRAYWDAWQKITEGHAIAIGTRSAMLAPGLWDRIIMTYEDDAAYKQEDQNPRYHTHDIAEYRRKHHGTHLLFIAHAPRVTTWHHVSQRIIEHSTAPIHLLDMRGSHHAEGILHDESVRAITQYLDAGRQATLMVARSGYAGSVLCRDCGFVLACPTCKRPSRLQSQKLFCTICRTTRPLPNACPQCRGAFFDMQGMGTERITHIAHQVFGERAHACITVAAAPEALPEHTQCVIVVSGEALLHHPDFRAAERTYQWLSRIAAKAREKNAELLVQSWTPEHPLFTALVQGKPDFFYTRELDERRLAHYPPFVQSALAIVKSGVAGTRAHTAPPELPHTLIARAEKAGILVSEPYVRRDPTKGMLQTVQYIRHPIDRDEQEFIDFLASIPEPWIIDREPENIF